MNVLVLGLGRIGSLHARHVADDPRVDRLLVVEPDPERRAWGLRVLGPSVEAVADLDAALGEDIHAAVVATPTDLHFAHASRLLDAGIATFCEKPLALSVTAVRELERRSAGIVPLMVGFQRRFDDGHRRLAEACAQVRERGSPPTLYRMATADRAAPTAAFLATAGSIFHDMLIHDFDVLGLLCPSPVVAVTARASPAALPVGSPGWGTAVVTCEMADGALAVLTGTRATGSGYEVSCQATSGAGVFGIGAASAGTPLCHLDAPAMGGPAHRDFLDRFCDAYRRELVTFLGVACGDGAAVPGTAEMLRALTLAEAAVTSVLSVASADDEAPGHPQRVRLDG